MPRDGAMKSRDWLVLTLESQSEPIRIQKTLFKLSEESELPKRERYTFQPYNWGPFSARIYSDLDQLVELGLVSRTPRPRSSWADYALTAKGKDEAARVRARADHGGLAGLARISSWVAERPFAQLLQDVYKDYPGMASRTLFDRR